VPNSPFLLQGNFRIGAFQGQCLQFFGCDRKQFFRGVFGGLLFLRTIRIDGIKCRQHNQNA